RRAARRPAQPALRAGREPPALAEGAAGQAAARLKPRLRSPAMSAPDFVHLHVHSEYSLLDGANRIGDLVAACVADGQKSLALTDHGNLFGAIELYQKCRAAGIKPLIGCEVYIAQK